MKLRCPQCGHEFEGAIFLDSLGWYSSCPKCMSPFDVDVPKHHLSLDPSCLKCNCSDHGVCSLSPDENLCSGALTEMQNCAYC